MTLHLEEIDPESWQIREVYAEFGLALYAAQIVEHGIANLAAWSGARDRARTTFEMIDADYAALRSVEARPRRAHSSVAGLRGVNQPTLTRRQDAWVRDDNNGLLVSALQCPSGRRPSSA